MLQKIKKLLGLSNGQTNAPETENKLLSGNIKETNRIDGTPFTIVTTDNNKCFIAIGNNRVSEIMKHKEAFNMIDNKEWELITNTINVLADHITKDRIKLINAEENKNQTAWNAENKNQTKLFNTQNL